MKVVVYYKDSSFRTFLGVTIMKHYRNDLFLYAGSSLPFIIDLTAVNSVHVCV